MITNSSWKELFKGLPLSLALSMVIFGAHPGTAMLLFLIVYLLTFRHNIRLPTGSTMIIVLLLAQYQVIHLVSAMTSNQMPLGFEVAPAATEELWGLSIFGLVLMALYTETYSGLLRAFKVLAPIVVAVAALGLSLDYYWSDACRVMFKNWDVFAAPLMMTSVTIAWLGVNTPLGTR